MQTYSAVLSPTEWSRLGVCLPKTTALFIKWTKKKNLIIMKRTLFILQNGSANTVIKAGINPCVAVKNTL